MASRVTVVSGNYIPRKCGLSHFVFRLTSKLEPRFSFRFLSSQEAARQDQNGHVKAATNGWGFRDIFALARRIIRDQDKTDILHIHHSAASYGFRREIFLLPLFLRWAGYRRPVVTTVHEYGNWEPSLSPLPPPLGNALKSIGQHLGWWDREDGFLLTGSDAVVATNPETRLLLEERLPGKQITMIPIAPSIEPDARHPALTRALLFSKYGIPEQAFLFSYFGFLHPWKGLENLIQAFDRIRTTDPVPYLLIIGGEESVAFAGQKAAGFRKRLEDLIRERGLEKRVFITGYAADETISAYLQSSDAGVLPLKNGVNVKNSSFLTMLSHHLPVVASCALDSQRYLGEESVALQVEPENIDGLARGMRRIATDRNLREHMKLKSDIFAGRYSWERIAGDYAGTYARLMPH